MAEIILANLSDLSGFASNVVAVAGTSYAATSQGIYLITPSAPFAFTLPSPSNVTSGAFVIVKDQTGVALTDPITISPTSGNIEGSATVVINTAYGEEWFCWNGSSWSIFNQHRTGPKTVLAGNATLVGGTVTVTNSAVTAAGIVMLTPKTAGGTPGTLHYTITSGSFTITSTSGTDTSVVSYLLLIAS